MNKSLLRSVGFYFFVFLFLSIQTQSISSEWAETTAKITSSEALDTGGYDFTLEYNVPESTAINQKGEPIKGLIQQHGILEKKPVVPQDIKIRYLKEEPVIFKWIGKIQYSKVAS